MVLIQLKDSAKLQMQSEARFSSVLSATPHGLTKTLEDLWYEVNKEQKLKIDTQNSMIATRYSNRKSVGLMRKIQITWIN